ncbi:uncharacterized protein [Littorina saxatilis]|uniref:Uncharacterized protein n=1 Tax=Littorina saxatilis TaxID=31220 RepID=A0AAN9AP54_9CAEN
MSNQQVNKVDLSLDDIIKLNKKAKQSRGGNNRTQGNAGARGQSVRGRKHAGGKGGGGGGASPLLRKKAGMTGGTVRGQTVGRRGQGAGRRGQRGNLRGRGGSSSSSRGGSVTRNTNSGYNTSTRGFRTGGIRGIRRGARGNIRGSFRGRGNANNQGIMQRVGMQGQGDGVTNRISLKQKRQLAMQALRQARKTIAQLDQQNARQTVVNARRGIPQQNVQNPRPLGKKKQGMYSSNLSLVSSSSLSSAGSARQLQGTKVTTFNTSASPDPSLAPQNTRNKRRRWRAKSQTPSLPGISSSTLTISIDNAPSQAHGAPHVSNVPAAPAPRQQRQRRRQWRRQNSNSSFDSVDVNVNRGAAPSFDSVDMNRGATPSFAQQLAKLKPTSSTKYVFQKKAFSTGNTTLPLNDRFSGSGSEDIMGRKVFM